MRAFLAAVALASAGVPAARAGAEPFAGTIEMKISSTKGPGGTIKVIVGAAGAVSEMTMTAPPGALSPGGGAGSGFTMKTLTRKDKPDVVFLINDKDKTYAEVPSAQPQSGGDETWTVKKVGTETIASYATTHTKCTSSKGSVVDMWTAKDVVDPAEFARALGKQSKLSGSLMESLKKEGADGFPVKMTTAGRDGVSITMELVKLTKGAAPASTFELPKGYTKSDVAGAAALPPDLQRQLQEKMKNLTPEQRAALEKAMGGVQQQQAPAPH